MSDTIQNIVVPANTVVDLYADAGIVAAGIAVGDQISVEMIGDGQCKLFSGESLTGEPTDDIGYSMLYPRSIKVNDSGDLGAFVWSLHGCTLNVGLA